MSYSSYNAVWQILKLTPIAYRKYLYLKINTITKFSLFRVKHIIDWVVYLMIDKHNYFITAIH